MQVLNVSGSTIAAHKAFYITGYNSTYDLLTIDLAKADSSSTMPCAGITRESIDNNDTGAVYLTGGILREFDTSSYSEGDILFLSADTAGSLTSTPTAQAVGVVLYADSAGWLKLNIGPADMARTTETLQFTSFQNGTTPPTLTLIDYFPSWAFTINDDSVFSVRIPKDWDGSSSLTVNITWYINRAYGAESGEIRWTAGWTAVPIDESEAIDAATHTGSLDSGDINIPSSAKYVTKTEIGTIAASNLEAGDRFGLKVQRTAIIDGNNPGGGVEPCATVVTVDYVSNKIGEAA